MYLGVVLSLIAMKSVCWCGPTPKSGQIVGETKGRGKLGANPKKGTVIVPIKDVWVYPLDQNFRTLLKST